MAFESDLTKIVDTMFFATTQIAFLCKFFNLAYSRHNLVKMEAFIKGTSFNQINKRQENIANRALKNCRRVASSFRYSCVVTIFLMAISSAINYKEYKLPCTGWYPFDKQKYYWVVESGKLFKHLFVMNYLFFREYLCFKF